MKFLKSTYKNFQYALKLLILRQFQNLLLSKFQVVPLARLLEYPKIAKVGDEIKFSVVDALEGPVEAIVVDPTGKEHRMLVLEGSSAGEHSFEYKIPSVGLHSVNVFHKKLPLTGSPFPLRAKPKS